MVVKIRAVTYPRNATSRNHPQTTQIWFKQPFKYFITISYDSAVIMILRKVLIASRAPLGFIFTLLLYRYYHYRYYHYHYHYRYYRRPLLKPEAGAAAWLDDC